MSKYIAGLIVLIFLAPCFSQYVVETKNNHSISLCESVVYAAKEQAKQEGYFTPEIIDNMKSEIAKIFKIEKGEIIVNVTTTPKYRMNEFDERELISYEIGVPIKKIIGANSSWGISDEDNQMIRYIRGSVASEKNYEVE